MRAVVGAILLIVILRLIHPDEMITAFREADFFLVAVAALLLPLNLGIQILKWNLILRLTQRKYLLKDVVASFLFGFMLGTITPGHLGEFGGRAMALNTESPAQIIGLTLIDRLQYLTAMLCTGGFSLLVLTRPGTSLPFVLLALVLSTVILLTIKPVLAKEWLERLGAGRIGNKWVRGILSSVDLVGTRTAVLLLLITFVFYVLLYVQFFFLLRAFSVATAWDTFLGFSAMMLVKTLFPLSLGDLGIREGSSVYFLSLLGVPAAASFNAAILLFLINVFLPTLGGLIFLPKTIWMKPLASKGPAV